MRRLLPLLAALALVPALSAQTGTAEFIVFARADDGGPVAGVPVTVASEDPAGPTFTTATDAAGLVTVAGVPDGRYFAFAAEGSAYATLISDPAVVQGSQSEIGVAFLTPLDPALATVRGRLTDADTGAPVRLRWLVPLPVGPTGGEVAPFAAVDGDGRYAFQVDPGTYELAYLLLNSEDESAATYGAATVAFTVTAGATTTVDVALDGRRRGALAGSVVGPDGSPVAGAEVVASSTDGTFETAAETGADGAFALSVPEGDYVIEVDAAGFLSEFWDGAGSFADATVVAVAPDATASGIDVTLETVAADFALTITGRLTDAAGDPIPDGAVLILSNTTQATIQAVRAQSDGTFAFTTRNPGAAGGEVVVWFQAPGYESEFYDDATEFFLATPLAVRGEAVSFDLGDVALRAEGDAPAGFAVSGTVSAESGGAIAGATVVVTRVDGAGVAYATTDGAGAYRAEGLAAGEYVVLFTAEGFAPSYYDGATAWTEAARVSVQSDVSAISGQLGGLNRPVRGARRSGVALRGTVRDGSGAALPGALVVARDPDGSAVGFALADASGRYAIEDLGETATVRADRPRYEVGRGVVSGGGVLTFRLGSLGATSAAGAPDAERPSLVVAPNPTAGTARVAFSVAEAGRVRVAVYDVLGREVAVLADGARPAGPGEARLDAPLAPGVYVVRVETASGAAAVPVTVVR